MRAGIPDRTDAERRARMRTALIANGLIDMATAGFFLGWGASVLKLEYRTAWLIAAILAAAGVVSFFVATLGFGRKGAGRALDEGEDNEPVVRR
ncbi:MAG TPA: hypothetical protein VIF14_01080 [Alphaproteobacteria bacterium]|jgi:hypothetical protein